MAWDDVLGELGLTPLLNASGTETVWGASPVSPDIVQAIAGILPHSVDMAELQAVASREIAAATGAEAGLVTGCSSAGLVVAAAACMTGLDLGRIERLPDTAGMRNEIVLQKGHVVNYGSSITGDLRLTGARVIEFGAAMETGLYQLQAALGPSTGAAVFVISHHAAPTGMIPLEAFIAACHAASVPVIVDAAAEYGWPDMVRAGADLVVFSAQKAIGGPTAGIIAGRRDLVRACHAQSRGIGRPMKAGKEAVVGSIAALRRWTATDHVARRREVSEKADRLIAALSDIAGLRAEKVADETGNPFDRVILHIDPATAGFSAWGMAKALARSLPRVMVRTLVADRGMLQVDVRRLDRKGETIVGRALADAASAARQASDISEPPAPADSSAAAVLNWLA